MLSSATRVPVLPLSFAELLSCFSKGSVGQLSLVGRQANTCCVCLGTKVEQVHKGARKWGQNPLLLNPHALGLTTSHWNSSRSPQCIVNRDTGTLKLQKDNYRKKKMLKIPNYPTWITQGMPLPSLNHCLAPRVLRPCEHLTLILFLSQMYMFHLEKKPNPQ